jgi:hypothetical protein
MAWHKGLARYPNLKRVVFGRSYVAPAYSSSASPSARLGSPDIWYGGKIASELSRRMEGVEVIDAFTR